MVTVPPVNVDWTVDYTVAHSQAPRRASTRREFHKVQVAHPRWDLASEIMSAKTSSYGGFKLHFFSKLQL